MDEATLIPTFSRAERDRRWALVRKRMKDAELDCLSDFRMTVASSSFKPIRAI